MSGQPHWSQSKIVFDQCGDPILQSDLDRSACMSRSNDTGRAPRTNDEAFGVRQVDEGRTPRTLKEAFGPDATWPVRVPFLRRHATALIIGALVVAELLALYFQGPLQ